MPTVGLFHTNYWEFSDTNAAPVHFSKGGYAGWEAGVILPSLFGIVGAWIDTYWALLKWHWRLGTRVHRLTGESRAVVLKVLDTLERREYSHAQQAVRKTAHTLGFNQHANMNVMGHYLKHQNGRLENTYRHLHACKTLQETAGSTVTNWDQNLMVELAYHGYTVSRK